MNNEKILSPHSISTPRKYWLDSLRALAMIFVVLVHASSGLPHWNTYTVLTGPIMLPLFFAISGYLFHGSNVKQGTFYKKLTLKLILPWFVLSLIWARAFLIPVKGFSPYFTQAFYKFISGSTLWYFSCCILAEIIQFYIRKFIKNFYFVCLADLLCCVIGFVLVFLDIGTFLNINTAFVAQFFMMVGYIFRTKEDWFGRFTWKSILPLLLGYFGFAILSIFIFPNGCVDVNRHMYPNIPYFFALIALGILALFLTAKKLDFKPKILVFIGQNTLFIYAMHSFGFEVTRKILSMLNVDAPNNWLFAILLSIFAILWCGIGAVIVNKFLPEIVGKRRKKRKSVAQDR